jgi:hypothetical protein
MKQNTGYSINHFYGSNGTAALKNVKNYLETSGGQSSNLYLSAVHFFQHQR